MATYQELHDLVGSTSLRQKISVAVAVEADVIRAEANTVTDHTARLAWAKGAIASPSSKVESMIWAVFAQNKNATTTAIEGSTDAQLQTAVAAAVALLI